MLPYYCFFILLIFCCFTEIYTEGRVNKLLYPFVFLCYIFFFGFRGFVGWDVINYYAHYQYNEHDTFEIGYSNLVNIFRYLDFDFFVFIFIITLFQGFFLFKIFRKYSPYPILSLWLCISVSALNIQIETLRHNFLLIIFLYSLKFIKGKNIKSYSICMLIGFLFHKMALFLWVIYFLYHYLFSKKIGNEFKSRNFLISFLFYLGWVLFFLNISPIIYFSDFLSRITIFHSVDLMEKLYYYAHVGHYVGTYSDAWKRIALPILLSFPIWIFRKRIIEFNEEVRFIYNVYILSWLISIYTVGFLVIWFRVYVLTFMFTFWILLPILIKVLGKYLRVIFFFFLLLFSTLRVIYTIHKFPYLDYKNILFENDSYEIRKNIIEDFDKERGLG
ncbi:hypothetical protein BKG95_04025 [Rodentibacter pneumotropicus]|uniref:EpsG family protein n=1 Tax=Rodentibacter pneumotropicus TaxID=758 RepID=A0AAW5LDY2_9PAST|nr:EpsG family protein [Rodentibacter pneumotropicus]MCQ9121681.1 EpsG family protein [Rodentibacter pneumotropicus]OOF68574.1 hypothetical protein BKG95_04025 [Rodentibacter pneumotropicus]